MEHRKRLARRLAWAVPVTVVVFAAALVIFGPAERTLGDRIKIVYVHVALTWAGMAGFAAAGLLGVGALLRPTPALDGWLQTVGRVAFAVYVDGFAVSIAAQQVSWGGVGWREPRTVKALQVMGVGLILLVLGAWLPDVRVRGALALAMAAFALWFGRTGAGLLHPDSAVRASSSSSIRLTFYGLFVLCCVGMVWAVWWIHQRGGTYAERW